jgi:ABC-type cobalamin/Fe3+-siderophores transport system ATPase subunit
MAKKLLLSTTILAAFVSLHAPQAHAADIKIGDINSYSALPAFAEPYRKGWQMAVDEINAAGGVNGDKLVVISKDDGGKPTTAITAVNELVAQDGVVMLTGSYFSSIVLAISDYARQRKVMYLAGKPLTDAITWSKGNAYTFRLRPSNYMLTAMLAEQAAKLPAKRWATIAPNYEYGQSAVSVFKDLLTKKRPDVTFVSAQTDLTVGENLAVGRQAPRPGFEPGTPERLYAFFPNLAEMRNRPGGRMSGGEQQMLTIARTLRGSPSLVLLDEPSDGLAPKIVKEMAGVILPMKREGVSLLVSEQNLHFARLIAERAVILESGRMRFSDTMQALEADAAARNAYLSI